MAPKRAKGKGNKKANPTGDVAFALSLSCGVGERDIRRLVSIFPNALEGEPKEVASLVKELYCAVGRVCGCDEGLQDFVTLGGVPEMRRLQHAILNPTADDGQPSDPDPVLNKHLNHCKASFEIMATIAARWINSLDQLDFFHIPMVLALAEGLAQESEAMGLAVLNKVLAYADHQVSHRVYMLKAGVLKPLHRILKEHRMPEVVSETLMVIYRVTDLPEACAVPFVKQELELIHSIGEDMQLAPVNFRIQLLGFRCMMLWLTNARAQIEDEDIAEEIERAIFESGACDVMSNAVSMLRKAGYKDMAAWMHTVAGTTLDKLHKKWAKRLVEEAKSEAKSAASSSKASGK